MRVEGLVVGDAGGEFEVLGTVWATPHGLEAHVHILPRLRAAHSDYSASRQIHAVAETAQKLLEALRIELNITPPVNLAYQPL